MRDRFDVRIEEPAETVLLEMSERSAARLVSALKMLEIDPWVFSQKQGETSSASVKMLEKRGYKVRRLKVQDVGDWRVFYYVDTRRTWVVVKEIIKRDEDTYADQAPHIRRLVENYRKHFFGEEEH